MSAQTATVEVLTAEVRVLQVGSRQVTLSVFRQLDHVPPAEIEPFGRVCDSGDPDIIEAVGSHHGVLTRSSVSRAWRVCGHAGYPEGTAACKERSRLWSRAEAARNAPLPAAPAPPPTFAQPPWGVSQTLAEQLAYQGYHQAMQEWGREKEAQQREAEVALRRFYEHPGHGWYICQPSQELWERFGALPLIVLAGLR
jgi:hypothetical protein